MVIVAIIGLLGTISTMGFMRQQQDEQANSVAVELSGWLASIQRAALRGKRCDVTIAPEGKDLAGGDVAARAQEAGVTSSPSISNGCLMYTPLRITSVDPSTRFTITPERESFSFTPRGTISQASDPLVFRIDLQGTPVSRCVKIEGLLGLAAVGRMVGSNCEVPS